MKKALYVVLLIALLIGGSFLFSSSVPVVQKEVSTTEQPLEIEIADSDAERVQGLSGRKEVPDNYGLLFVFDKADTYGFWMKDMYVSIDIIWLRDDGTIIGIEDSVSPATYPNTFYAPEPVRYVLETRAGYARDHEWTIGNIVPITLPE